MIKKGYFYHIYILAFSYQVNYEKLYRFLTFKSITGVVSQFVTPTKIVAIIAKFVDIFHIYGYGGLRD